MVATLKMLAFLLLCFLIYIGAAGSSYEQCKVSDLAVIQTAMARRDGGYTVYAVRVENRCICSQGYLKLACQGFNSSVRVYPAGILRPDGDGLCTLNGAYSISQGPEYAVKFYYGWRSKLSLAPVSSIIACS
ncbi:hypothetical protein BDA96_05G144100 [Sorghum bicolor]|uniref:Uncharacterized protein n=2 Tax=Sorghum bicolor TaxID=4558 RepID=A0A921UFS7_SORBI|nr:hypothetical protein SORBI_3005G130900 [Sorghum bicolor]KAG0529974.1 hypothetical protein BDA96_05G144100 [Sorghum bicolor]